MFARLLRRGHLLDDERIQNRRAALEQRLRELGNVVGVGEQTRVASHSAHLPRSGIMDRAAQSLTCVFVPLSGCDARHPGRRRIEAGRNHAQRAEDILLCVLIQGHAADLLHQFTEDDETHVAVQERCAGRVHQLGGVGTGVAFFQSVPGLLEVEVGGQPGVVGQQHADGDVVLAILREVGDVLGNGIVQLDLAKLLQSHDAGGSGDDLGERCQVENGVDGHGLGFGADGAVAVRFVVSREPVVRDQQHGTRRIALATAFFRTSSRGANQLCSSFEAGGADGAAADGGVCVRVGLWMFRVPGGGLLRRNKHADEKEKANIHQHVGWPAQMQAEENLSHDGRCPATERQAIIGCARTWLQQEGFSEFADAIRFRRSYACIRAVRRSQFARVFAMLREAIVERAFPGAKSTVTYGGALVASRGFRAVHL